MADYKRFYIQQQTFDGATYTNVGRAVEANTYCVVCQEFPFKYYPDAKELPKRDWVDEDGDDVYYPNGGMKLKAFDIEAKFLYVGPISTHREGSTTVLGMHDNLVKFIDILYGRNSGGSSCLLIYDEYTDTAYHNVYVAEVGNELYEYNDVNINAHAQFTVKFRVNDPIPTTFNVQ